MFSTFENKVVAVLRQSLPDALVADERIMPGPVEQPQVLPAIAFTAGDFEVLQDGQIFDIPKDSEELHMRVSSRLQVWAEELTKVEEITLKVMAAILVHAKAIENESGGEMETDELALAFTTHDLRALKGVKLSANGAPATGAIDYTLESKMTVTRKAFDFGEIETIEGKLALLGRRDGEPEVLPFLISSKQAVLEKPVTVIRGIGAVTKDKLAKKGVLTVRELSLVDKDAFKNEISNIASLVQKAKSVRRIALEALREIVDREHPFPPVHFKTILPRIVEMSVEDLMNETDKSEERCAIFLGNLRELNDDLIKASEFEKLGLMDFI